MKKRQQGFTMIELLVAMGVTVVVLLGAVLWSRVPDTRKFPPLRLSGSIPTNTGPSVPLVSRVIVPAWAGKERVAQDKTSAVIPKQNFLGFIYNTPMRLA